VGLELHDTAFRQLRPVTTLATTRPHQGWNVGVYIYGAQGLADASFGANVKQWRASGIAAKKVKNVVVTVALKGRAISRPAPPWPMPQLVVRALATLTHANVAHRTRSLAGAMRTARPTRPASISSPGVSPEMVVSPNWSGYVAIAPTKPSYKHPYFTSVTGTWRVPTANCAHHKAGASSTVWVGLGGFATKNQEEVGTSSNCTASGRPIYFAWFELVPYLSSRAFPEIRNKISPGDTITGSVKVLSPTLVQVRIQDRTRGWSFMRKITFSSQDTFTADWIVSAPADCVKYTCHEANLANFGSVTMRNISAVGKGSPGTLKDPHWKVVPVRLVPSKLLVPAISPSPTPVGPAKTGQAQSPAGATPGPVSRDGTSFSLKWIAVARRGL